MTSSSSFSRSAHQDAITACYIADESKLVHRLLANIDLGAEARTCIHQEACALVTSIRRSDKTRTAIDDLLQEYGLSTEEGVMLMRLSEALIRTPDYATSRTLIRDKIGDADWSAHAGKSGSFLVNQATMGLHITAGWIEATGGTKAKSLFAKLGDRVMERAMAQAMNVMGNHFVLGRTIKEACTRANKMAAHGVAHSYDMLGEAAYTHADATRYFTAYLEAIRFLAQTPQPHDIMQRAGLSVKLSALHPRYEFAKRQECIPVLITRVAQIAHTAADAGLWLNIDAEEADRLELSLEVFAALLRDPYLADWPGLGMVVQAYQKRAMPALDYIHDLARTAKRKVTVRLVKGAYWDMEIKRAQELGLADYPVFTRKENTDVSYLACARQLFNFSEHLYPQFATHNAHSAIAVTHMAKGRPFEFQRLHGMGAALHEGLTTRYGAQSRVYAPVGTHKNLLPYLVRRLLENGANGSFVHQVMDDTIPAKKVTQDPVATIQAHTQIAHPKIPKPTQIAEKGRLCAAGIDLTQPNIAVAFERIAASNGVHNVTSLVAEEESTSTQTRDVFSPHDQAHKVGTVQTLGVDAINKIVTVAAASNWHASTTPQQRAQILEKAADLLESERDVFLELCVREAGKTLPDAVAELREAVDFCRYYASQAQEDRLIGRVPLGVVACISPWNFPLAIFIGQIVAALSVGNSVVTKPAPQTQIIAATAAMLLRRAGVPADALQLVLGDGALLGRELTRHPSIAGVCFTGSTRTAKIIAANLADTGRGGIPLIAETGGINTMIVDSTALLEQAVQDTIASAFQSAGQRCSACRIVCVQKEIADSFITMLKGAMATLEMGDPTKLSTDIGPVIDATACGIIDDYKASIPHSWETLATCNIPNKLEAGVFSAPTLIEVPRISDVQCEIFGPVLHLVRFDATKLDALLEDINKLGFGLTLGIHTRLDDRIQDITEKAHVGNLYVNRNQIGAVVGIHPFGGEALSGTGPKAGGPSYLTGLTKNLCTDNVISDAPPPPLISAGAMERTALNLVLDNAQQAATLWSKTKSHHARLAILDDFLKATIGENHAWEAALKYEEITDLPGPTGEVNTLRLFPRGIMLCFADDATNLAKQIARALVAGSCVIAAQTDTKQKTQQHWLRVMQKTSPPAHLIQWVSPADGLALLNMDINGIVADGAIRHLVAAHACRRHGPILPILSVTDPIDRYLQERTLTVNTTAAGGNASLLAMQ